MVVFAQKLLYSIDQVHVTPKAIFYFADQVISSCWTTIFSGISSQLMTQIVLSNDTHRNSWWFTGHVCWRVRHHLSTSILPCIEPHSNVTHDMVMTHIIFKFEHDLLWWRMRRRKMTQMACWVDTNIAIRWFVYRCEDTNNVSWWHAGHVELTKAKSSDHASMTRCDEDTYKSWHAWSVVRTQASF